MILVISFTGSLSVGGSIFRTTIIFTLNVNTMIKNFKIELPNGFKINDIQSELHGDGTTATITVYMEEKYTPKDGDFVRVINSFQEIIAIYNKKVDGNIAVEPKLYYHVAIWKVGGDPRIKDWTFYKEVFPATAEEIDKLKEALTKEGKRWNAEKKCIEDLPRWKADIKETYFYVSAHCSIESEVECNDYIDNERYNIGNYFHIREEAEKVAKQVKEIFMKSKAE